MSIIPIELTQIGSIGSIIYLFRDDDTPLSLSDLSDVTAADETFIEGAAQRFLNLESIAGMGHRNWRRYNIETVATVVEYLATPGDVTSWTTLGATGFQGLLPTEYTINPNANNGRLGFRIHASSIDNDITGRLRLAIIITDNNMANLELLVPFDVESLTSAGSLANATNVTARTYREGATIDTFGLAQFISGLSGWGDVHWDSAAAIMQVSTDSGVTWETHSSEQDGLDTDEYTLDTDDLLANGNVGFRLHAESILSDIAHDDTTRFRILVTLTSGVYTIYVNIPVNLRAPTSLNSLTTPQTTASITYREGAGEVRFAIANVLTGISDIDDVNLDNAPVIVEYQAIEGDDTSWTPMGSTGFQGLLPTEYTVDNDIRSSVASDRGEVGFRVHNNVIESAITGRLRFKITLTDDS